MHRLNPECGIEILNERCPGTLPGWYGIKVVSLEAGCWSPKWRSARDAGTQRLHAASVIALADTCAGFATIAHLPLGGNFTTLELKPTSSAPRPRSAAAWPARCIQVERPGVGRRSDWRGRAQAGAVPLPQMIFAQAA